MTEPPPLDLIHLTDAAGNSCIVRVTGRCEPGVPTGYDILRADVLVSASHMDARLVIYLFPRDLDDWQRDLADLVPGQKAGLGGDRSVNVVLDMLEDHWLIVDVHAPDLLYTNLELRPEGYWLEEHRDRLEQVRLAWPNEVI